MERRSVGGGDRSPEVANRHLRNGTCEVARNEFKGTILIDLGASEKTGVNTYVDAWSDGVWGDEINSQK